ncbi:MAG: hypothetical protein NTW27_02405 [Deltaproteobacteria bacterium]|nr:hypothetical protein [Deltaproteobacteria bacterium]
MKQRSKAVILAPQHVLRHFIIQKWMTLSGVRTTYEAAAQWMEEIFGLDLALTERSSE